MRTSHNEQGYTMLETIMYISILIVLGGVIASYVGTVFTRYKTGRISQQIVDLKKAVMHFTAADEDYGDLSLDKMLKDNAIPFDMKAGLHALSGKIEMGPVSSVLGEAEINNRYMFFIKFTQLPRASCVEVLSQGQFYNGGSDIDTLIVNDKHAWMYKYSLYDTSGLQFLHEMKEVAGSAAIHLTVSDAFNACDNKESNSITWVFS